MNDSPALQRPSSALDWLDGSEMGKLIRARDWSNTPLGPLETWPQSLRTTVSLCLGSNFPIAFTWGPQHTLIYNDSYRPNCGAKHPHSMGQDFKKCWAAAWSVVGDIFEQAMAGKTTFLANQRFFLNRSGYLEEAFFTFSFSPIRDENGHVVGVFHPVTELTQESLGKRRLKILSALAAGTAAARTVTEAITLTLETLAASDADLPFLMFYTLDADQKRARLAGQSGLPAGTAASPVVIDPADSVSSPWPIARVVAQRRSEVVDIPPAHRGDVICGPYWEAPRQALLIPIIPSGQTQVLGVLIAGVSSRRELDEPYRTFFELLGKGIGDAVSSARAYELEHRRAEALAEIDRAKTAFFSNVSHEFRTPLTLMLGPLEALAAANLPADDRQQVNLAYRNALRLQKLVNTLLDFSRVEAGRVEARYVPTDLAAYTSDLASIFRSAVEKAGLSLTVDCPPLPEPIYVDQEMWEKIVLNLLSNAFKHTFDGGIRVTLRRLDQCVECAIADSGVGIAAAELPKVFDRFSRIKGARSRTHEGTGIGLALVKELVMAHRGIILAESQEGQGTTFTVRLPLGCAHLPAQQIGAAPLPATMDAAAFADEAQLWLSNMPTEIVPPSPSALENELQTNTSGAPEKTRPRILLVDDNADMRDYVRRLLATRYAVTALPDGAQAVASALAEPPDLVLTDLMMPGLDGLGVLRAMRADERTRTVPVILLSARAGVDAATEGLNAGADDYLVKPFSAGELMSRIHANLASAALRAEWGRELERQVAARTADLAQTTADLQVAKSDAERANNAKSRFLAAASHDLRQPLSALTLYVQILKGKVSTANRKYLDNIQDCVGSLSGLLTDLLDLSKLEAGVTKAKVCAFPLAETLEAMLSIHAPEAELKGLHLRCVPSRLMARTDPILFNRMLGNLIDNAIRYTERGGVVFGCRRRQGRISVEVWDSGIGIAADKTAEAFEEFRQLGDHARTRGSGLGLAIVAKTAALLGLAVRVHSHPGRGSMFAIELPEEHTMQVSKHTSAIREYKSLRIAFVEDNPLVREALTHALQTTGHEVIAAASGAALLAGLGAQAPDIVLSDYRLPHGETGFEVISAARSAFGASLPAILITGDTDPALTRSIVERGIIVLHKPLDLEILQAYLEDLTTLGQEAH